MTSPDLRATPVGDVGAGRPQRDAEPLSYAASGVDVEAGDRAVDLMKASVAAASRPEVVSGLGGFAGLFDATALRGMTRPVLATSTDGVGTKVAIAQALDRHDTVGYDLVGMVVDDIVVCGAEPLFLTDYIAAGKVVPDRIAAIVSGIAGACAQAGVALVGGETAEHPGLLDPGEYDIAGAATGVVEYAELLGPARVRAGDALIALASSGLHANGYSLVRAVLARTGWRLEAHVPEFGRTLGEELLEPTRVYATDLLRLIRTPGIDVHALSHVTGGGLAANLARVLPSGFTGTIDRATWTPPPVFGVIGEAGGVPVADLERTFNMGVGFVVVLPDAHADAAVDVMSGAGVPAWRLGHVEEQPPGRRELSGAPPAALPAADRPQDVVVTGSKGLAGGSARLVGDHPA